MTNKELQEILRTYQDDLRVIVAGTWAEVENIVEDIYEDDIFLIINPQNIVNDPDDLLEE